MTTTTRLALAALCAVDALVAGVASALGVFARGDSTFVTVTSARGEIYEMATSGVYADNAQQLVAEAGGCVQVSGRWSAAARGEALLAELLACVASLT